MDDVTDKKKCFGDLEIVFPEGENGLRCSPAECFECDLKTACLRTAMKGSKGLAVKETKVDRAYDSGAMGFFERWSRKKALKKRQKRSKTSKEAKNE